MPLIAVASLVAEQSLGLEAFSSCSSQAVEHTIVVVHGLSCGTWDLLDQGSNPCLLH